ncbi:MAG: hypothetical protein P8183_09010 [Anaerolineae bacterium]
MENSRTAFPNSFLVKLTFLAWLSMLGVDFFLHAGVLAPLYAVPSPFLLPPERAFALIPVGYASFLLLAVLLVWLMVKLERRGWRQGAVFGAQVGGLAWGALILGLYSITTASPALLLGWFIGQTVELSMAGIVVGIGLESIGLRRLFFQVLGTVIVLVVLSVIMQNIG